MEAGARRFVVADPTVGERKLTAAEVSKCFTGVALELEPGDQYRQQGRREAMCRGGSNA